MKKHVAKLALVFGAVLMLSGCVFVRGPVVPPVGFTFNATGFPMDINYEENKIGPASGSAESISILGLVALGDTSLTTAAANGGLKTVNHVDTHFFNILGIYQLYTITAYGESAAN